MSARKQAQNTIPIYKVTIVGASDVGKSACILQFMYDEVRASLQISLSVLTYSNFYL